MARHETDPTVVRCMGKKFVGCAATLASRLLLTDTVQTTAGHHGFG